MECLLGMKGFIKGRLFSLFQPESIYLDYEQSPSFLKSVEQNARHANRHARD